MDQKGIVRLLEKEKDRLTKQVRGIAAALAAFGTTYVNGTHTRGIAAALRLRLRFPWTQSKPKSANCRNQAITRFELQSGF